MPPGSPLPSETELMDQFTASRGTVREAIALLRREGLVVTAQGRGSFVRSRLPVRRRGSERYREDVANLYDTPFTRDNPGPPDGFSIDRTYSTVGASLEVAELFGVAVDEPTLERVLVFRINGIPQQIATSRFLDSMATGTILAEFGEGPWIPSDTALLAAIGVRVTRIREVIASRMPTADEVDLLMIPSGVPVVSIIRQTFADTKVVEVAHIVIPADRVELEYVIDLANP